jgi:hypothetical protein
MAVGLLPFSEASWLMDLRLKIACHFYESMGQDRPSKGLLAFWFLLPTWIHYRYIADVCT